MNLDSIKDNNNINFFVKNKELGLTISTTEGLINNIEFKEQDIIKDLHTNNCIIRIESNFGDIITSDIYEEILKSKIKPKIGKTRGRKPYVKISKNRKKLGEERVFHSQIEFFYLDGPSQNVYRIKLFVNGRIQVPGVRKEDFSDIKDLLDNFTKYVNAIDVLKKDPSVNCEVLYMMSNMRNYKTELEFYNESNNTALEQIMKIDLRNTANILKCYKEYDTNNNMFLINHSTERPRLIIKFLTPLPKENQDIINKWKPEYNKKKKSRKTTIIIFASCKINVSGANNLKEAQELFDYLLTILNKEKSKVFYEMR